MPTHFQISVTITPEFIEPLSDIFFDCGAEAVTMTDAKDEPLFQLSPEDNPHWQHTTLHALFDEFALLENIIFDIKKNYVAFQSLDFYIEKFAPKDWVLETQKYFQSQQFGKVLWVCPQWEKTSFQVSRYKKDPVIFIEPGLAFGTGSHPTTQLCLTWLATHSLKKQCIIDYGCGSGILALSALALDAKTVWATDHDQQALISTENNAKYNAFKNELHIVNIDDIQSARADIIIANILADPLITLMPILTKLLLPKGKLILSGILATDMERVADVYKNDFTKIDMQQQDEWVLMEFQKI